MAYSKCFTVNHGGRRVRVIGHRAPNNVPLRLVAYNKEPAPAGEPEVALEIWVRFDTGVNCAVGTRRGSLGNLETCGAGVGGDPGEGRGRQ